MWKNHLWSKLAPLLLLRDEQTTVTVPASHFRLKMEMIGLDFGVGWKIGWWTFTNLDKAERVKTWSDRLRASCAINLVSNILVGEIYTIQSVDENDFNQRVTCSHKVGSNKKTIGGLSGTCKKLWPADPGTLFKYVIAWYSMVLYDLQLHWYYKVILSDWRHLKKSNWPGSWPCCRAAGSSAAYSWSQTYSIVVTAWIKPIQ